MKDQIDIIRDKLGKFAAVYIDAGNRIVAALDQLEAMAGSQEPVAWAMPKGDGTFIDVITPAEHARKEGSYTVPLFAHPVAQQPQAEAITEAKIDAYLEDYEMVGEAEDGRDACYAPSEGEKVLIKDAIMGLLAEAPLKQPQAEAVPLQPASEDDMAVYRAIAAGYKKDVAPQQPQAEASPTSGMNMAQRILHVGGRNNAAGYVEFGSVQAVEALVRQVLRDLPKPRRIPDHELVTMYDEGPSSDSEMLDFAHAVMDAMQAAPQHAEAVPSDVVRQAIDAAMAQGEKP